MQKQTVLATCLLTVLALSWLAGAAHASSVNYAIHDGKVSAELSLQFYENATAIPNVSEKFTGVAAQDLTSAIEKALKSKADGLSVSSLSADLASSRDWVNVSIRFDVDGAVVQNGGVLDANCSWITFKVPDDLRLGNVSYNLVGATYLRSEFEKYVNFDKAPLNETIQDVTYVVNTMPLSPFDAVNRAGNATLLDFSYLASNLESWRTTYNFTLDSTKWTLTNIPVSQMSMKVTPRGENPFTVAASYSYNATLLIDGLAQAHGEVISTETSADYQPILMLIVVVATFIVAVLTSWVYRSRRKQLPRRRK